MKHLTVYVLCSISALLIACDAKTLDKVKDVTGGVLKLGQDLLMVAPAIIGDVVDIKDSLKPRSPI